MLWGLIKDVARKGAHVAADLSGSAAAALAGATVASTGVATSIIDAVWAESGMVLIRSNLRGTDGTACAGPFVFTDAQWVLYSKYITYCDAGDEERAEGVFSGAAGKGVVAEMINAGWRRPFRGPYSQEADPALYLLAVAKAQYRAGHSP